MKSLDQYWNSLNWLVILLLPVSMLYRLLAAVRRLCYRTGLFKAVKVSVPVIVVGNISVGGTGKTPLIIELVKQLSSWGLKVGVVSRGYGGAGPFPAKVTGASNAEQVGDEPLQIVKRTGVALVVGPDRVEAANKLIDEVKPDLILTDDGLQHYRLRRDLELIVTDSARGFGNGLLLPSGPLREPVSRLTENTDLSWNIINGADSGYGFVIKPVAVKAVSDNSQKSLDNFKTGKVHAVAGIGHPERFFTMLEQYGVEIIRHSFPDHYQYTAADLEFNDQLPVLMTEKDSVKCKEFSNDKLWFVEIDIELTKIFLTDFKHKVAELTNG